MSARAPRPPAEKPQKAATSPPQPRDKNAAFISSLTEEQRQQAVKLLSQEPAIPAAEVARILDCNPQVIYRLARKQGTVRLDRASRYRRRLDRELPVARRAEILAKIARGQHPDSSSALRALERIDELTGLAQRGQAANPIPGVMFHLPADGELGIEVADAAAVVSNPTRVPAERVEIDAAELAPEPAIAPGNSPGSGYSRTVKGSGRRKAPKAPY